MHDFVWVSKQIFFQARGSRGGHWVCAAAVYLVAGACPCPVPLMPPHPMPSRAKAGSLSQSLGPAGARPFLTSSLTCMYYPPARDTLQVSTCMTVQPPKESVGLSKSEVTDSVAWVVKWDINVFKPQNIFVETGSHPDNAKSTHPISSLLKSQGSLIPWCDRVGCCC